MKRNHNTLTRKLPAAVLLATVALAGCSKASKSPVEVPSVPPSVGTSEAPAPHTAKAFNTAKSAGKILLAAGSEGNHDILLRDLKTGKDTNLTNTPGVDELNPQLSPDGKEVLMAGNATGNYQVYRFTLAKPQEKAQLTKTDARNDDPTWAPSGKTVYFKSNIQGSGDIWRMTREGTNQQDVTKGMDTTEEWKPTAITDTQIVLTRQHGDDGSMSREQLSATSELYLLDTTSDAEPVRLTNNKWPDWYSEADPSRPGVIAYTSKAPNNPTGSDVIMQMNVNKPAESKLLVELPGDSSDNSWAPGGNLLFVNNADGTYHPMARTPGGDIYDLNLGEQDKALSPVAAGGPITIG